MTIPNNIRKEDVVKAIQEADREPWPSTRNAKTHHLLHGGRLYPVKYIISLASRHAGNGKLPSAAFTTNGGQPYLKRLGFTIVSQPSASPTQNGVMEPNTYRNEGMAMYINNSATEKRCPFLFPRTDITGEPNKGDRLNTGRCLAYTDAYALIFYGNGGKSIPCGGDKQVANLLIKNGYLELDKGKNTLSPGIQLEKAGYLLRDKKNIFRLNPKRFISGTKKHSIAGLQHPHENTPGKFYQAICEGVISAPLIDETIAQDIEKIVFDKAINATTRQALIDARIGQGKFRRDVMARWEDACAFSGCMTEAVLRASHIKRWCECSNEERLDPANGLLLTANLDALFDRWLISFEDDGRILISSGLSDGERELLHLGEGRLRGNMDARMRNYLKHHRKKFIA